jgi:4-hydroxythreonine-4-phosphate dehydrogenase
VSGTSLPIALTCGDPAGIGAEIALKARAVLGAEVPFFWIGDPAHLPEGAAFSVIDVPEAAAGVAADVLPVLAHGFPCPALPGRPDPANAQAVIDVIARAWGWCRGGRPRPSALCPSTRRC